MKQYIYFFIITMFFTGFSYAQNGERKFCGTTKIMEEALQDPEKKQILDQLEIFTENFIANMENNRLGGPYIIPVVVHVIHYYEEENISYEQIDNGILRINEDFSGLNDDLDEVIDSFTDIVGFPQIEFRLATKDPDGNCTYGVTRTASPWTENSGSKVMSLTNWDDRKYVNIYVVKSFDENMSSAAAYATKPGSGSSEYGDYIFCRYDYFGDWNTNSDNGPTGNNWARHTMPHEMGHFFNLDHPWGGSNSPAEDGNCSIDDGVEDTPPTIGTDGNAVGCPLDQATCDGSLDNVQNIMDYASCAHMFTQGQADRMLAAANSLAGNRWYLWQESNLVATGTDDSSVNNSPYADCAPIPDFRSDTDLGCSGAVISFENFTYNYRNESITYSWSFEGGSPSQSENINPTVQYDMPGTYDVSLTACNGGFCRDTILENYITILSQMNVSAEDGLSQSFESSSFPNMSSEIWWVGDSHEEEHWKRTDLVSSEGGSSFKIKSQNYGYERRSHEFSTPELNLSEFTTSGSDPLMLCFDVAYAKRLPYTAVEQDDDGFVTDTYSIHHDELIVSYKGCGDSQWTERPRLSTRPGTSGLYLSLQDTLWTTDKVYFNSFTPAPNEWKQFCVTIQQLAGDDEAIIKFEFVGTGEDQYSMHLVDADGFLEYITASTIGGNWLYLDNILIGNSSVIQNESASRNVNLENLIVSPNPSSSNEASISLDVIEESEVVFSLTNFLGINVSSKKLVLSSGYHQFLLEDLFSIPNKGSYIIGVQGLESRLSEIIIIR